MRGRGTVVCIVAFFLALAFPLTAHAQSIFVSGGAAIPTGDYGDFADVGWMVAGGVSFDIGDTGFFAGAEGLYSRSTTEFDFVSVKPWSAMGFLGYGIPTDANISPFVWAGAGLQGVTETEDGENFTESGFGYAFGAGVSFVTRGNLSPYIEARFQGSSDEAVDLHFFGIGAGILIRLGN